MSSSEQGTVAIVNCKEDYHSLKSSMSPLFEEINSVYRDGFLLVDDQRVEIELLFGSDMKMIQIMLGLEGSTGNYACPWCLVHKEDRWCTDHGWLHYHDTLGRTLESTKTHADNLQYEAQHQPLIKIDVSNYVIDELHLMMRITDVLERNLIDEAQERDRRLKKDKQPVRHLNEIVQCFTDCGVTFAVWEDRNSSQLSWTSLSGHAKKKVIERLPQLLKGKLDSETEATVIQLWTDFHNLYDSICHENDKSAVDIFKDAQNWLKLFLSANHQSKGYQKQNVTPYIHCLVYHVPVMIDRFGPLHCLRGQAMEKLNDEIKVIHQKKTQTWDAAREALSVRKRMEENRGCVREKRPYTKRKLVYWDENLPTIRHQKRCRIQEMIAATDNTAQRLSADDMRASDIRDTLAQHGVTTRVTSRTKLATMLEKL